MTLETAVTKLHTAVADPWSPVTDPTVEIGPEALLALGPDVIVISRTTATDLLAIIADLCDTHGACAICERPMCEDCGINWPDGLPSDACGRIHCEGCIDDCAACTREVAASEQADEYADAIGGRY